MFALFRELLNVYNTYFIEYGDPTTKKWFLVSNPIPVFTLMIFYLYFSTSLGPRFMKNRKPFDLRYIVRTFNFLQIIYNAWMFSEVFYHGWLRYKPICEPVPIGDDDPHVYRVKVLCWWYFICKLTDFIDTVFFVLRKKTSHVSYLHLIHHFGMPAIAYICTRYFPGGHVTFTGLINTFVHTVMYTYYFITSLGPQYSKYLWWKKHLTLLQMVQFLLIFLHLLSAVIFECCVSKLLVYYYMVNTLFMTLMFASFYHQAYIKKKTS